MIFKDWVSKRLKEVGKTWNDLTKAGVGGQTQYNIQHNKFGFLKEGTMQKIALVLQVCQGDVIKAVQEHRREMGMTTPEEAVEKSVKRIEESKEDDNPFCELPEDVDEESDEDIADFLKEVENDSVYHPVHYTQGGIECIEAIKASMTPESFLGFLKGNVLKYLWRYEKKNGVEDLQKARWYLDRLIKERERK